MIKTMENPCKTFTYSELLAPRLSMPLELRRFYLELDVGSTNRAVSVSLTSATSKFTLHNDS